MAIYLNPFRFGRDIQTEGHGLLFTSYPLCNTRIMHNLVPDELVFECVDIHLRLRLIGQVHNSTQPIKRTNHMSGYRRMLTCSERRYMRRRRWRLDYYVMAQTCPRKWNDRKQDSGLSKPITSQSKAETSCQQRTELSTKHIFSKRILTSQFSPCTRIIFCASAITV
jgi:hypothetical protein